MMSAALWMSMHGRKRQLGDFQALIFLHSARDSSYEAGYSHQIISLLRFSITMNSLIIILSAASHAWALNNGKLALNQKFLKISAKVIKALENFPH